MEERVRKPSQRITGAQKAQPRRNGGAAILKRIKSVNFQNK